MKRILLIILTLGAFVGGCATSSRLATGDAVPGTLFLKLSLSGEALDDSRVYVDGHFVGNYVPDGMLLRLPAGSHIVRVDIPRVHLRYSRPDGSGVGRTFTMKGEERIEVLG